MADQFEGIGGSYILNKDGLREKVEGTVDKLEAPLESAVVAEPVVKSAPSSKADDASAKGE